MYGGNGCGNCQFAISMHGSWGYGDVVVVVRAYPKRSSLIHLFSVKLYMSKW